MCATPPPYTRALEFVDAFCLDVLCVGLFSLHPLTQDVWSARRRGDLPCEGTLLLALAAESVS